MDNDRVGKREAIWLLREYNIIPILIPEEYAVKDFSELVENYSDDCINTLTYNTINYIQDNYAEDNQIVWNTEESNIVPY